MSPSPTLPRVAAGAAFLSLLAAYSLAVVDRGFALHDAQLAEAFALGTYLGSPAPWFLARMGCYALLSLAVAFLAIGGDPAALGRASSTAWRRALAVEAPLLLAPAALAQEELLRRPPIVALCVGASVGLAAYLRPGEGAPDEARGGWRAHAPALAVIALHAAAFAHLAIARDRAMWSATVDLGIFKEALWNTLHGRAMHSSTVGYSFLGEHFAPVLFALVPLYALWPTSACLLSVQTLAVSAAAWPLYRFALELGLSRAVATALAAAMLFSPPMHTALLYDFHMDLLAVPAVAWLALSLRRRAWGAACASLVALLSVKEEMFIPALAVLLARALTGDRRDRVRAAAMGAASLAWGLVAMLWLLKRFGPPHGVPVYMADSNAPEQGYKFLRSFRHLKGQAGGPLRALLGQPVRFALYAFTGPRLTTFLGFVAPLAFAPLAAGRAVVLLAPLAVVMLSDNAEVVSLRYHYGAVQHPGVFLAAALGVAAVAARVPRRGRFEEAFAALVVAGLAVQLGMHPASALARAHVADQRAYSLHVRAVEGLVARVPPDARVSATSFVGPRMSNRPWINVFPRGLDRATHALVDTQRPPWPLATGVRDATVRALLRSGWGVVDHADGAVLLARGYAPDRNAAAVRDLFVHYHYEVEGTEWTEFPHCVVRDPAASDGFARVVDPSDPRAPGFVVFGPMLQLPPARYRVTFRLRAEPVISRDEPIGAVDVTSRGRVVAARALDAGAFPTGAWVNVSLDFLVTPETGDEIEFRVRTTKRWLLGADAIRLVVPENEGAVVEQMIAR